MYLFGDKINEKLTHVLKKDMKISFILLPCLQNCIQ